MRDLRLVQRREHREHTNAHPCEEPAAIHIVDILCGSLDGASKEEDEAAEEDGAAPPDVVRE